MKRKLPVLIFILIGGLTVIILLSNRYFGSQGRKTINPSINSPVSPTAVMETGNGEADDDRTQLLKVCDQIAAGWNIPNLKYDLKVKKIVGNYALVWVIPLNQTLDPLQIILAKENGTWVYKNMGSTFPDWEQKVPELFTG